MKIFIDMSHPAHVHLFKNFFWEMRERGHIFKITARDKDVTLNLLDAYGIPYELVGKKRNKGLFFLLNEWIIREIKIFKIAKEFQPDILIGNLNPAIAHVGKILGKKTIIFTDQEPRALKFPIADLLILPFADKILTLESVQYSYGRREIRINSYKEMAYLHPNWFKPDEGILKKYGFSKNDKIILVRFVDWGAYHDFGERTISLDQKKKLIEELRNFGKVLISSEKQVPECFTQYILKINPEDIHHFLYFAQLLVCDSQTMTTEAAILGTPVIRSNSFVGINDMGNFKELERKYGLIYNTRDFEFMVRKIRNLLNTPELKSTFLRKRDELLKEKSDLTSFFIDYISNV